MKQYYIGITGKAGAGKDTTAQMIADYVQLYYPHVEVSNFAFARGLKHVLATLFQVDENIFSDPELKMLPMNELYGKSPREIAQWFGTDVVRKLNPNHWVNFMKRNINDYLKSSITLSDSCVFTFSDVRFDNEAEYILENDGVILQIERKDLPYGVMSHASEAGLSKDIPTVVLHNYGTLEDLRKLVYHTIDNNLM